jgi:hypothetical protein
MTDMKYELLTELHSRLEADLLESISKRTASMWS